MTTGGQTGDTGILIRIGAVDLATNKIRAVAAEARMLPAHFSQIGGALKNFGLKFVLPVYSLSKLAQSAAATIRELSVLTDRANDAGMAAPVLQKLVGAMQQVGVRAASIDTVAAAMQHMARTTGEVGAEGFAKVLGQAARLESEAERLDFLSRAFGRTNGAAFAALIRDGDAGIRKLIDLASGYPAVSDASAQAADAAADAMARATDAIKAGWGELLGTVVSWIEESFGPLPELAETVAHGIILAFKRVGDFFRAFSLGLRVIFEPVVRTITIAISAVSRLSRAVSDSNYSFRDALRDTWRDAGDEYGEMIGQWNKIAEKIHDDSNLGASAETRPVFQSMTSAIAKGGVSFRNEATKAIADMASAISNAFSKGGSFALKGSNEAAKIIRGSASGSAVQSQRTVTQFLPRIAQGIERTVSGIGDMVSTFGELEAI